MQTGAFATSTRFSRFLPWALTLQLNLNGAAYATVQFDPSANSSAVVPGFGLPAFHAGDLITLDVTGVGTTYPGSDLTLVIRL